jgi:hypothetical protein
MDINTTNTIVTIVGFISTVASLILSVVAIWLSIVFFKMSSNLSNTTTEAAKGIGVSVDRLEKLFDKLYADTFSMMRDTVSDMRRHIWPENKSDVEDMSQAIEKKADDKVDKLRQEVDSELSRLLKGQKVTDANIGSLRKEMRDLIEKVIQVSRKAEIEAREETIRDKIISILSRHKGMVAGDLHEAICEISGPCQPHEMIDELIKMKSEGLIDIFMHDREVKSVRGLY